MRRRDEETPGDPKFDTFAVRRWREAGDCPCGSESGVRFQKALRHREDKAELTDKQRTAAVKAMRCELTCTQSRRQCPNR